MSCSSRIDIRAPATCSTNLAELLTDADSVFVLPIYAASEEPLPGITAELLTSKITSPVAQYAPDSVAAIDAVAATAREGDLIMTLGAGSVSQLGPANSGSPSNQDVS